MKKESWIQFDVTALEVLKTIGMKYFVFIGYDAIPTVEIYPFKTKNKAELFMVANSYEPSDYHNLIPLCDEMKNFVDDSMANVKVLVLFN